MSKLIRFFLMALLSWPLVLVAGTQAEVGTAIQKKDWPLVTRQAFALASALDGSRVEHLAATGMTEEAVAAALKFFPSSRSALLLQINEVGPNLPIAKKTQIARLALEQAATPGIPASIAAGNLAEVALALTDLGLDESARSAFAAALALGAVKEPAKPDDDATRSVAHVLAKNPKRKVPEWMLGALVNQLPKIADASSPAFAHIDVARAYFNLGKKAEAKTQLELALAAADRMPKGMRRNGAKSALTQLAAENGEVAFARRHGTESAFAPALASFHARSGNRAQALAQLAKTGPDTLYMSDKQAVSQQIIREALERKDAAAASFYAAEFHDLPATERVTAWTGIGKLQAEMGAVENAKASFQRAKEMLLLNDPYTAARDVTATLKLSLAIHESSLPALASEVATLAERQANYIHSRRGGERAIAEGRVSEAVAQMGHREAATRLLVQAWSNTSGLPEDSHSRKMEKAEALRQLGLAAHRLGQKNLPPRKASPGGRK